ncbi:PREDICTED: ran-binding protein 3 [Papilio polytes]|uniref:ran-binding protein 3 n=1 Tax=Papilio polytes TaxID=76194 RepID=UPI000676917B|nr:PREDICTED: ran-binding protein 3 [Papilio polytes]
MADAKQGKATQEDLHNGSSQSRVILAKPRLGGFGSSSFASSSNKTCNPFASVLRPPQLKPTSNPFYKLAEKSENVETEKENPPQSEPVERLQDKKEEVDSPKFVPLASGGATTRSSSTVPAPAQPTTATSSAGFVFGQNISERVVMADSVNNGDATGLDHSSSNGTSELLFTNAAASVKENNQEEAGPSESTGEGLAAAAAEYERSHARPPPTTSNCTTTGEEDEINVLQITCRLFAWESGSWRERGRGVLRLNDAPQGSGGGGSRLVVRVAGSLRVVLNTKLWPDMVLERAGAKSLRITAFDAQLQIKLYLIMGAPCDIVHLYRALTARISGSKRTISCNQNVRSQRAAERLEAATDDADYPDKPDFNEDDSCFEEDKQNLPELQQDEGGEPIISNRLENNTEKKTDEEESNVHIKIDDENESNALKRKEPIENETSPKRQCPEIVIQRP